MNIPLSVVVVRVSSDPAHLGVCLEGLLASAGEVPGTQVVVAQSARAPAFATGGVMVVTGSEADGPSSLRSLGVHAATGDCIALTEDHCVPAPGWCRRVVDAHRDPPSAAAIGGPIELASWLSGADLAASLLAYARYLPPLSAANVTSLSDCNVSYKRDALRSVAAVWEREFVETDVHAALVRSGGTLRLDPDMVVTQGRRIDMAAALREQRIHGEEYARGRAGRVGGAERLGRALASSLVPPFVTMRSIVHARSRGLGASRLAAAAPALFRLAAAWADGEVRGYRRWGRVG